jgi:hypothetical protein
LSFARAKIRDCSNRFAPRCRHAYQAGVYEGIAEAGFTPNSLPPVSGGSTQAHWSSTNMIAFRISPLLSSLALLVLCHASAFAQQAQATERDRATIAEMSLNQLIMSILNVRTDLKEYSTDDLTTTSGQYELFYDETMGPCKHRGHQAQPYALCAGASLNVSFASQAQSNRRICPEAVTNSCWKPALTKNQMREELFDLVDRNRHAQRPADPGQLTTVTSTPEIEEFAHSH